MIESSAISNKTREINYVFPLHIYPTEEQKRLGLAREPNLDKGFIEAVEAALGLECGSGDSGNLQQTFGPEDVLHYIYAVLHSPEYRLRYAGFLRLDFPRVPVTGDRSLFQALVEHGRRLVSLHLMESGAGDGTAFPKAGSNRVSWVRYAPPSNGVPGRVSINRDQYFEGIALEAWGCTIGGYRPAEKWLKDRQDRVLSYEDIAHYQRMCSILAETPNVMARIDEAIEVHGGWPLS